MRAICRPMTAGSAVRDFSFRQQYDNEGSSVSMTYGLIGSALPGARLAVSRTNRWVAPAADVLASHRTGQFRTSYAAGIVGGAGGNKCFLFFLQHAAVGELASSGRDFPPSRL